MKIAASNALSRLAKEPVPAEVLKAYNLKSLEYGRDYVVPKPLDRRVCLWEAPEVAKAAITSGVARISVDLDKYPEQLRNRLGFR